MDITNKTGSKLILCRRTTKWQWPNTRPKELLIYRDDHIKNSTDVTPWHKAPTQHQGKRPLTCSQDEMHWPDTVTNTLNRHWLHAGSDTEKKAPTSQTGWWTQTDHQDDRVHFCTWDNHREHAPTLYRDKTIQAKQTECHSHTQEVTDLKECKKKWTNDAGKIRMNANENTTCHGGRSYREQNPRDRRFCRKPREKTERW